MEPARTARAHMACSLGRPPFLQFQARSQTAFIMLGNADLTSLTLACGHRRRHCPPSSLPASAAWSATIQASKELLWLACALGPHELLDRANLGYHNPVISTSGLVARRGRLRHPSAVQPDRSRYWGPQWAPASARGCTAILSL